ncbi:hypothetical protein [Alkaliphilus peptidifermentans]|uniref:Uncharacterized protein n=1 Tax=Alkaliphilus peptidifermentans DSM 18978 TaxID=1120976 RepID=A0A1G5LFH2_9FIRM|nr:hypothetical protein [Alkaliphilus peptidifermentans]SCZ11000.1 hypothetical protein SAMN03080606_04329 [Alkaliphilus peptidifermentans DSM 18978]
MENFLAVLAALMPIVTIILTVILKEKFTDKVYSNCKPYNKYRGNWVLNTLTWLVYNILVFEIGILVHFGILLLILNMKFYFDSLLMIFTAMIIVESLLLAFYLYKTSKNKLIANNLESFKKARNLLLTINFPMSAMFTIGILYVIGFYLDKSISIGLFFIVSSITLTIIGMSYSKNFYIRYLPKFKFIVILTDGTSIECDEITEIKDKLIIEKNISTNSCKKQQFIEKSLTDIKWIEAEVELAEI